jgi:hypothetical protein
MHYDLTVANSSTWYWWLAVSPYDYKDGLVYIDKNKTNGNLTDSKLLWAWAISAVLSDQAWAGIT